MGTGELCNVECVEGYFAPAESGQIKGAHQQWVVEHYRHFDRRFSKYFQADLVTVTISFFDSNGPAVDDQINFAPTGGMDPKYYE